MREEWGTNSSPHNSPTPRSYFHIYFIHTHLTTMREDWGTNWSITPATTAPSEQPPLPDLEPDPDLRMSQEACGDNPPK